MNYLDKPSLFVSVDEVILTNVLESLFINCKHFIAVVIICIFRLMNSSSLAHLFRGEP